MEGWLASAEKTWTIPLVGIGLTHLQLVNGRPSNSCHLSNNIVLVTPEGQETCWKCPNCPVGHGLEPPCGSKVPNTTAIECKHCKANVTYSENHDISSCRPCHDCGLKNVVQQCTIDKNRKCGTACPTGYYYSQATDECKICFHCCSTVTDDDRVDACITSGMPRHMQCKETNKNRRCKELDDQKTTKQPITQRETTRSPITVSYTTPTKELSTLLQEQPDKPTLRRTLPSGVTINKSSYFNSDSAGRGQTTAITIIATASFLLFIFLFVVIAYKKRKRRSSDISKNIKRGTPCVMPLLKQNPTKLDTTYRDNAITLSLEQIPEGLQISKVLDLYHGGRSLGTHITNSLDVRKRNVANWKDVGRAFHVPGEELDTMELEYSASKSPTVCLIDTFKTWGSEKEPTVREFVEVLGNLGRAELAEYICNWPWKNCYAQSTT